MLISAGAIISWPTLMAVCDIAVRDDRQSHILLVLPVSVVLTYSERYKIVRTAAYCLPASIALVSCWVTSAWLGGNRLGVSQYALSLQMCLLVCGCIAAFILCYGVAAFRTAAFPLLFLLFTVPIPGFALERAIWLLQKSSADLTYLLLKAAKIPVSQEGVVLLLPRFDIEVTRECSGIRSSLMLLVVTLVLGHLFLRSGWTKGLLGVLVLPIAIAKNGLRLFVLSALGANVDPSFLDGKLHRFGGIPSFGVALGVVMFVVWWLCKSENKQTGERGVAISRSS